MTDRRALAAAELEVLDLEDELAAAKDGGADGPEYRELKLKLREARRVHRTLREGDDPIEGVARPATVEVTGEVA